jgi:hypothetical protein
MRSLSPEFGHSRLTFVGSFEKRLRASHPRGQNNANWTIVSFVLTLKLNQKGAGAAVIFSRTPADIARFLGMATKFFAQSPFIAIYQLSGC